jgi:hypothetical protein
MAGVQDILQASHALLDRLVKARTATGATKVKAGQVQLQATRPGFAAVAAGMARVQEGLTRLVAAQGAQSDAVKAAIALVQTVKDDTSPAEVVSTLTAAGQKVDAAKTGAAAGVTAIDGLKGQIGATLRGGEAGPLQATAEQVKQLMVQAIGAAEEAHRRIDQTIDEARKTGNF